MAIVIKKRVNLDFLGDDYQQAYLIFRSIPIGDYEKILDELPSPNPEYVSLVQEAETGELSTEKQARLKKLQEEETVNNKKNLKMVVDYLKKYFLTGKFPNADTNELEEVKSAEDLDGLDSNCALKCFAVLTGQDSDPKDKPSQTPSTTADVPQTNS